MMRVLVVGSGGREHALTWILRKSDMVAEIFVAPGNPGNRKLGTFVDLDPTNIVEIADFAQEVAIDLTLVGPELPLSLGIVDEFEERGLACFGPRKNAAALESSKVFTKEFLHRHSIPSAEFRVARSIQEAEELLAEEVFSYPLVVKAEGLAAGKGVVIANDPGEAGEACRAMMVDRKFGQAGERIVIEEFLQGIEMSFLALTDGKSVVPLVSSQDFKRIYDDDKGPNTGGMGAISPSPYITKELQTQVLQEVILPTVKGLEEEGRPYKGVLYAGLMLTTEGPKVLEYNCRFGDPETQAVLPRLSSDILPYFMACVEGGLGELAPLEWKKEACACVVAASAGYPASSDKGQEIRGLKDAGMMDRVVVFHAGTAEDEDGTIRTAGGRVLNVVSMEPSLKGAVERAYSAMEKISFDGMQFRRDIGLRAIANMELRNRESSDE